MDKGKLKSYAVWGRRKLTEDIRQRAIGLGITENGLTVCDFGSGQFSPEMHRWDNQFPEAWEKLVAAVKAKNLNFVVEETACTWFIRLVALRFMEVNDYLSTGVRVLSSTVVDKREPDILTQALHRDLDFSLDDNLVLKWQNDNEWEHLYRYLLIMQCRQLQGILPGLFGIGADYTEILLPGNLLQEDSVISRMITEIPAENFTDRVEVVGWLYQYYIAGKKDQVFDNLRDNIKVSKEDIPAVTQLFTPEWIVKYMVENSLGRLWLEGHPNRELQSQWQYYLPEARQTPEVAARFAQMRTQRRDVRPENITVLDPAMGSGHILVYAFDVLYAIYQSEGYREQDIPQLILTRNLYGLDIDDRAGRLTCFALLMKARSRDRRIFEKKLHLNVRAFTDNPGLRWTAEGLARSGGPAAAPGDQTVETGEGATGDGGGLFATGAGADGLERLLKAFEEAKLYGSLLTIDPGEFRFLAARYEVWLNQTGAEAVPAGGEDDSLTCLAALVEQAKILSGRYDVVITNPPYMGRKGMNSQLSGFLGRHFTAAKADLSTAFLEQCRQLLKPSGLLAMINQHGWMFLSSFAAVRIKLLERNVIVNMVHLGTRAFEDIGGEVVQSTAFVICKIPARDYTGTFIRLLSYNNAGDKQRGFDEAMLELQDPTEPASITPDRHLRKAPILTYMAKMEGFASIPGHPVAYWVTGHDLAVFRQGRPLSFFGAPRQGLATGDNDRFLRLWHEVGIDSIGFNLKDRAEAMVCGKRWFPYNKGGNYRKWYGNTGYVVDWHHDGSAIRNWRDAQGKPRSRAQNVAFYFRAAVSWSKVTSGGFSARYFPEGFIFDVAGCSIFFEPDLSYYYLGLLNSKVAGRLLGFLSPTINYEVGHVAALPAIYRFVPRLDDLVKRCVQIARTEWDSYETSWEFRQHPLLIHRRGSGKIAGAFENWCEFTEAQFNALKTCEEEINRIFIDIYGLGTELTPEVDPGEICLRRADRVTGMKSFLSYFVGCCFGRYTPELADFTAGKEEVIPIFDQESGEVDDGNDVVGRFGEFVREIFGAGTLEENLADIAGTLGQHPNETSRQVIGRYLRRNFYRDHWQMYQKRPIYWLFESGPHNGFKAFVYIHRYNEFSIAKVRRYLRQQLEYYERVRQRLGQVGQTNLSGRDQAPAPQKQANLLAKIAECRRYDQALAVVQARPIKLVPDDGVAVNYAKFQAVEMPPGEGQPPLKFDLLAKM